MRSGVERYEEKYLGKHSECSTSEQWPMAIECKVLKLRIDNQDWFIIKI